MWIFLNRILLFFMGFMPKSLVRRFAARYIAGETLAEAVALVKELNRQGVMATLDVLGESIHQLSEAREAVEEYKRCLRAIAEQGLDATISLKPTAFGLALDREVARANIREVLEEASRLRIPVAMDMEDSPYTTATFELYLELKKTFPLFSTVMQAYLRRSMDDLQGMLKEMPNLRLVKGIYLEPRELAFKDGEIVNRNYVLLLETLVAGGGYAAIATHDEKLVWEGMRVVRQHKLPREAYEFQMLLGVDKGLRDIILAGGHRLRLYVPYGPQWYAYSMRRFKENPRVVSYILKNLTQAG